MGSLRGYDPLIETGTPNLQFEKKAAENPEIYHAEMGVTSRVVVPSPKQWRLEAIANAKPLAYLEETPQIRFPFLADMSGIRVENPDGHKGTVVLNFLWRRNFRAEADGKQVPLTHDDWGRLRVPLNEWKQLRLHYQPAWGLGFAIGALLLMAGLLVGKIRPALARKGNP